MVGAVGAGAMMRMAWTNLQTPAGPLWLPPV